MSVPREVESVFATLDLSSLDAGRPRVRLHRRVPPLLEVLLSTLGIAAGYALLFSTIGLVWGSREPWHAPWFATWFGGAVATLAGLIVFWTTWNRRHGRKTPVANDRLAAFAAANGFIFRPGLHEDPTLPATPGDARRVQLVGDRLATPPGAPYPAFEIARRLYPRRDQLPYREPHPSIHDYGWYVAVRLPRAVPHLALVRPGDRHESHLDQSARYSLGLEFDRHFTLLCPPGYERDALYLFTPDVMAAMIDDAGVGGFAAEVIDDILFFRFPPGDDLFTVDIRRALVLVARTAAELANQAENYRDERVERQAAQLVPARAPRLRARWRPAAVLTSIGILAGVMTSFLVFIPTVV